MGYVIGNADRETVNRFGGKTVVEHGLDHARGKLFGRQTVTAADNFRHVADFAVGESLSQRGNDVKVQRFADRTGFLGTVEDGNDLDRLRQSLQERLFRERTIQVNFQNAQFGAFGVQVVDGFFHRFGARTHNHDNLFGISRADIVDDMILTAGNLGKLVHFFLNDAFYLVIVRIAGFAALEEDVRVLRGTADNRSFRTQSVFGVEGIVHTLEHCSQIVVGKHFDFFDFVRSAETVKEVHERNARTQSRSLGDRGHVMSFLYRVGSQHGKTGLTAAHNVGMVTED